MNTSVLSRGDAAACDTSNPPAGTRRAAGTRIRVVTAMLMLALTAAAALCCMAAQARSDVVVLANGDRLTGEVRSLDRGKMRFNTDATDTIEIDWRYVSQLTAEQNFEIMLDDGSRLFGTLVDAGEPEHLRLLNDRDALDLPLARVVRMNPIEGRVIERIDTSVDVGFSLTKANDVSQANFGYDFRYRDEEQLLSLDVDATRALSQDDAASTRINTDLGYRRFLPDRDWDPVGWLQVERNDELGVRRRSAVGGGMGRWLADTNSHRISFAGGLVYGAEDAADASSDDSVEAIAALDLEWFRYEAPELDVTTRLTMYERLSGDSRTRGNLDLDVRWELVKDLFWGFSVYYSYEESTSVSAESTTDYGLVTSLGWDF